MSPKRITFLGLFGQQNWGNECTLQAIILNTRKHLPDFDIDCVCTVPEDTSKRYGVHAFPMQASSRSQKNDRVANGALFRLARKIFYLIPMELLHWCNAYRALKGTRMFIAPGTGLLTDFERNFFGRCYEIFMWSIIAKLRRSKLLFVSVGAGPILHSMSRWFIKSALSMADYRSYRNGFSKQYLEGIGLKTNNDSIYPDLAFSLPKAMMTEPENNKRNKIVIGVGVKDYYGKDSTQKQRDRIYQKYIDNTSDFVIWLLDNGYIVRILVGDTMYDNNVKMHLKKEINKRGYVYDNLNILDEPIHSVDQMIAQISATDVVVSPRFHNIILALMLNKPVISLSYHDKFASLMVDQELEEYCVNIDDLNITRLTDMFTKLMRNSEYIKSRIKIKTGENRLLLDKQYMFIFDNAANIHK